MSTPPTDPLSQTESQARVPVEKPLGQILLEQAKGVGPFVTALILLSVSLPGILGFVVITKSGFFRDQPRRGLALGLGGAALVVVGLAFALTTGSALLPTYALSIACGVYLGMAEGSAAAMIGVTLGALVGYFWGTILARKRVMAQIEHHPRAALIRRAIVDRGLAQETMAVGLIRIPPNSPFALTNLAMSATRVRLLPYVIGTAVGIAPRTIFAVWLGNQAGEIQKAKSTGGKWVAIVGVAVAIVVFLIVYRVFSRWVKQELNRRVGADAGERGDPRTDSDRNG
ncbi:MAG: VTT domain-containing protein [Phycisphaerales bacterium]